MEEAVPLGWATDEMALEARLKALQGLKVTWNFLL
jgi:hypothetical protein